VLRAGLTQVFPIVLLDVEVQLAHDPEAAHVHGEGSHLLLGAIAEPLDDHGWSALIFIGIDLAPCCGETGPVFDEPVDGFLEVQPSEPLFHVVGCSRYVVQIAVDAPVNVDSAEGVVLIDVSNCLWVAHGYSSYSSFSR